MAELLTPELTELLALKLEDAAPDEPNFFKVSGYPDHEFVLTNWYRFFFDSTEPHRLGTLFLEALCDVYNARQKGAQISWVTSACHANSEVPTAKKNGWVDLVLEDDPKSPSAAVIIENKLFADHSYNPYDDYLTCSQAPAKTGILLTLKPVQKQAHSGFLNITHRELTDAVRAKLGRVFHSIPGRYLEVLSDLFKHLDSFMEPLKDNPYLRVMAEYGPQFKKLLEVQQASEKALREAISTSFGSAGYRTVTTRDVISITSEDWPNIRAYLILGGMFTDRKARFTGWLITKPFVLAWSDWDDEEWVSLQNDYPLLKEYTKVGGTGKELFVLGKDYPDVFSTYTDLLVLPEKLLSLFKKEWHPSLKALHGELAKRVVA